MDSSDWISIGDLATELARLDTKSHESREIRARRELGRLWKKFWRREDLVAGLKGFGPAKIALDPIRPDDKSDATPELLARCIDDLGRRLPGEAVDVERWAEISNVNVFARGDEHVSVQNLFRRVEVPRSTLDLLASWWRARSMNNGRTLCVDLLLQLAKTTSAPITKEELWETVHQTLGDRVSGKTFDRAFKEVWPMHLTHRGRPRKPERKPTGPS